MPKFSIVSPVYNVSRYLDDFFACLERQTYGIENLEIVLVDDGSTDDSYEKCVAFRDRHPANVTVLTQDNAGQGPARNAGLEVVTGEWVTFPDPDDVLNDEYFAAIGDYMTQPESADAVLFAAHLLRWLEIRSEEKDDHPTAFRFKRGSSTVDLEQFPNHIHGNAPISFFITDVIKKAELLYDHRLRTRFEDACFVSEYLLNCERPIIGLVDEARYLYRIRDDGTSTLQASAVAPETYLDVPVHGHLRVVQEAMTTHGRVPTWLQTFLLYDIFWLMKSDGAHGRASRALPAEVFATFHEHMRQLRGYLADDVILSFDMMPVPRWVIESFAYGYADSHVGEVRVASVLGKTNLVELAYDYTGDPPVERFTVGRVEVQPRFQTIQHNPVLGASLLKTRRVWLTASGVIRVEIDGRQRSVSAFAVHARYKYRRAEFLKAVEADSAPDVPERFVKIAGSMRHELRQRVKARMNALRVGWFGRHAWEDRLLSAYIKLTPTRRKFLHSWSFIDRDWNANDSAEVLYRWLREHKPAVNAWFILRKESPDWARLKKDGFRLVAYRSFRWKALMLLTDYVISSHADGYITDPLPVARYGRPQWEFVFLQHGVIKGDLSKWLNAKRIRLFVTSTEPEYRYIAQDSPYRYSPAQVRLTGLPRYDALLAKSQRVPRSEVNQLIIAPTWRQYLIGRLVSGSERTLDDSFAQSDFAREWQALVRDPRLRDAAGEQGLELVFMPHPNFAVYLDRFEIPPWVRVQSYHGVDIQEVVSRAAMMITDYSSIAFNMAYLHRPTVYFQFDRDQYRVLHTEGDAYYDYERDGFGPVTRAADEVAELVHRLGHEPAFAQSYRERAELTFPVRDGRNCERVYEAIRATSKRLGVGAASVSAELETWASLTARDEA